MAILSLRRNRRLLVYAVLTASMLLGFVTACDECKDVGCTLTEDYCGNCECDPYEDILTRPNDCDIHSDDNPECEFFFF